MAARTGMESSEMLVVSQISKDRHVESDMGGNVGGVAGLPKIDMENVKWVADGPRE
jgi:hypothetical protein